MKISIVILSFNDYPGTTSLCLESLSQDPAFCDWEVFVVDNASDSSTQSALRLAQQQHPSVRFIFNEQNLGYAGGNNVGISLSTGEVVILLNSDTIAPSGMISRLAHHFDGYPALGMLGPVTNAAGNEQAIYTSAESITGIVDQGLAYANSGGAHLLETYRMDFHCVAIARHVIDQVGLLDEAFGRGYYEDFDYSLRVKKAGLALRVAEDVFIYHRGSASFKKLPKETRELLKRNKKLILKKHGKANISLLHARDANLAILAQYAQIKASGYAVPSYKIQNRLTLAHGNLPKSWLKRWRYLRRLRKIAASLE